MRIVKDCFNIITEILPKLHPTIFEEVKLVSSEFRHLRDFSAEC